MTVLVARKAFTVLAPLVTQLLLLRSLLAGEPDMDDVAATVRAAQGLCEQARDRVVVMGWTPVPVEEA